MPAMANFSLLAMHFNGQQAVHYTKFTFGKETVYHKSLVLWPRIQEFLIPNENRSI